MNVDVDHAENLPTSSSNEGETLRKVICILSLLTNASGQTGWRSVRMQQNRS